jgi:signal transduction histidine kinase
MTFPSDAQTMKPPTDLLFTSKLWEQALAKYAAATHVTVKLFDTDLRIVLGPIHSTPLFDIFDRGGYDPGLFAECARQCLEQTTERPAVTVSKVHGLAVVGTSLVLEDKVVGAAVAGYVLVDFSQLSEIERVAKDARIEFTRLWQVARQQSPISQQRLTLNGDLLQALGDALLRENFRTREYERIAAELQETARTKEQVHHKLLETASVLRQSEERYRTLFDLGPIAVYSCDASGIIRDYNHVAAELWGREPKPGDTDERWCGSFKMLRPNEIFMPHEQCPMAEVVSGKISEVRDAEVQIERPDGSRVIVLVNIRPLKNERGEITGAINCFVDITERKRAEESLREAKKTLEVRVKERTSALEARNAEILTQSDQLQELSLRLMRTQDEERRRIARELHDSLGQYLAAAKMSVEALKRSDATAKESRNLQQATDALEKCLTEARTISHLLHPPLLDEVGLSSAAKWYIEGFAERSGIQANMDITDVSQRLPSALELALFRILQESLVNVHRHSHSVSVDIQLKFSTNELILEVRDHGQGMPSELLERVKSNNRLGGGVGLRSMSGRIRELGGVFEIESDKNGTLIRVTAPVPEPITKSEVAFEKASAE